MPIRAVIFDLDGTITEPYLDFDAIREEIGLGKDGGPVLEAMEKMTPGQRQRAEDVLHCHEQRALAASTLNAGARETLAGLRARGVHIGVLTRNRKGNALAVAKKHGLQFDGVVGREDGPVKPDTFGVLYLCRQFGVDPAETLLVGDYVYDMQCARAAGAVPVLMANDHGPSEFAEQADFLVRNLGEILKIVDERNRADETVS